MSKHTLAASVSAILLLTACTDRPASEAPDAFWANTRPDSLVLKKGLGTVYLRVPRSYDTLFAWFYPSDCSSCGHIRYRFQPQLLRIYPETGYFETFDKKVPLDSVNQLTISHQEFLGELENHWNRSPIDDSADIFRHHPQALRNYALKRSKVDFDTLEKINGQFFSVVAYSHNDARGHQRYVTAETSLAGLPLRFNYMLLTQQNDSVTRHFQRDALRLLRTVRLRPGR